jgi:drug/metabolite transporter (DMT)-like permease
MHAPETLRGIGAMLVAVAFFSFMDALMKGLAGNYPALQVASLRGFASVPFVLAAVAARGRWSQLRPVNLRLHLLRGVLGVIMLGGFIYALGRLSMSDAYSLFMCAPLLVTALSVPLLRERVRAPQWIAIVVGLAGALVMLRPTGAGFASAGGFAALAAALAYALAVLTVRRLARTDSTESMVLTFTVLLALGAGLLALPAWVTVDWARDWPLIAGLGLTGAVGQYFVTEAFRHAPASTIAPFEYTAMVWAIAIDFAIWRVLPDGLTLAGSAIVIGAGLHLLQRERRAPPSAVNPET